MKSKISEKINVKLSELEFNNLEMCLSKYYEDTGELGIRELLKVIESEFGKMRLSIKVSDLKRLMTRIDIYLDYYDIKVMDRKNDSIVDLGLELLKYRDLFWKGSD